MAPPCPEQGPRGGMLPPSQSVNLVSSVSRSPENSAPAAGNRPDGDLTEFARLPNSYCAPDPPRTASTKPTAVKRLPP
jgi:hypothetical protein